MNLLVLVVDDDAISLRIAEAALARLGHRTIARPAALGTTPLILRERPDVIVLDVSMPGLRGDALAALVREQTSLRGSYRPIVILHSGTDEAELIHLTKRAGADGAIPKTSDPRTFAERFEQIVAAARQSV
jgi:CheY-like chemotaxis protein